MTPQEQFYTNVRTVMLRKKISAKLLAKKCGINYYTLLNKMSQNKSPTLDTMLNFSRGLGVSLKKLLEGVE